MALGTCPRWVLTEVPASEKKAPEALVASLVLKLLKNFIKDTTHQMIKSMRQRSLPFTPTENSEKSRRHIHACTEARYIHVHGRSTGVSPNDVMECIRALECIASIAS